MFIFETNTILVLRKKLIIYINFLLSVIDVYTVAYLTYFFPLIDFNYFLCYEFTFIF